MTYSTISPYSSSDSRVSSPSQESTACANFDFRNPRVVPVRYAALNVDGYFMQASSILEGISILTEYYGRMPELPRWVDMGVVLEN